MGGMVRLTRSAVDCPWPSRHGATPHSAVTNIAIRETPDRRNVTWMEKVSDETYLAGP